MQRKEGSFFSRGWLLVLGVVVLCWTGTMAFAAGTKEAPSNKITIKFNSYSTWTETGGVRTQLPEMMAIVNGYMKLHPNVTIAVDDSKMGGTDWIQAKYIAQDLPDIYAYNYDYIIQNYWKEWSISLNSMLDRPNPYVSGNQHWKDMFDPNMLNIVKAPDGNYYSIIYDSVGTELFYNKKLFADAGITSEPKTWAEFMTDLGKLKNLGVIPLADGPVLHWHAAVIRSQLLADKIAPFDKDKNEFLDIKEVALAVDSGKFPIKEVEMGFLNIEKGLQPYRAPGYLVDNDRSVGWNMFLNSKAAIDTEGNWSFRSLQDMGKDASFYGVMNYPVITKETTPAASGVQIKNVGPWGALSWTVPGYLARVDPTRLAAIEDFLKYMSVPQTVAPLLSKLQYSSYILGVPALPQLSVFSAPIHFIVMQGVSQVLDEQFGNEYQAIVENYVLGKTSEDQAWQQVLQAYKDGAKRLLDQNPGWRNE
jgi:ABC-type glycerol-3-phosphate transport system substrate-binding protein